MKKYNLLGFILLAILLSNCASENLFSIDQDKLKTQYTTAESLSVTVLNPKKEKIDSVVYSLNDTKIGTVKGDGKFEFSLNNQKLGYSNLKADFYSDGSTEKDSTRIEIVSAIATPKVLTYSIVNTYPHDIHAYTQGLEFHNGVLYEGTGQYGESTLRKLDYKTGKIDLKLDLEPRYFGEGITFLNGKIYQITWKENTAFVYDAATMKKEKEVPFYKSMEGWGLTNDGKNLYMTDSSERIHVLDPNSFQQIDFINVYSGKMKIDAVNELEWVDGKIYGNIYQKDFIVVINPKTGDVEAMLDLSDLKKKITLLPDTDVLNGIAYNPMTKTFFVTGKNWDKLFEIRIN